MLKKRFKGMRQRGSAVRVAQFVNDHGSGKRFAQQGLRDAHMRINTAGIDDAHAAARDRGDDKAAIFATGRKQLDGVARAHLEGVGQTRTDE